MVDFKHIYNASDSTISYLATFSSFGYLIGSLSGSLYRWINRQLTISILVACLSVTVATAPHFPYLWALFVAITVNGIGGGTWDSNNNVWLVEMWPQKNAPLIQGSQFMYGLGSIFGPIIVSPFVHGDNSSDWTPEERRRELTVPFSASGAIQILGKLAILLKHWHYLQLQT